MKLHVILESGNRDEFDSFVYETDENNNLHVLSATGFTIATYADGKWVNTRRILEQGETWPEMADIGDAPMNPDHDSVVVRGIPGLPKELGLDTTQPVPWTPERESAERPFD